jgi:hypothetical protein
MKVRTAHLLAWGAAAAALAAVFVLYTHPQTMVRLTDLLWACFN